MGTAMKHPVPDRVKPSFVIYDVQALWRSARASECPNVKNYKWWLNPVWHRMLYSCTHNDNSGRQRVNGNDVHELREQRRTSTTTIHFGKWQCEELSNWNRRSLSVQAAIHSSDTV